jgi:3-keto-L-gulonate-6-phosphate decarboxylase
VLGVGGEGAAERPELGGDEVAILGGLVLEDGQLLVSIELEVAVVGGGELGNEPAAPTPRSK